MKNAAIADLKEQILDHQLGCLLIDHEVEHREFLASLAVILAVGAEIAAKVHKRSLPLMVSSLYALELMAKNSWRWDSSWAAQLQQATTTSRTLILTNMKLATRLLPAACAYAGDIHSGTFGD